MAWVHCETEVPALDVKCDSKFSPCHWPEAVAVGARVFVFGYSCTNEDRGMEVIVFDTEDYSWRVVQPPPREGNPPASWAPSALMTFFAVASGHDIFVCGKGDDVFITETFHRFDTRTLRWSLADTYGDIPESACWLSAYPVQGKVLVCADIANGVTPNELCMFALDLDTLEWRYLCSVGWPVKYWPRGGAAFGSKVYMLFAKYFSPRGEDDRVAVFDMEKEQWEQLDVCGKMKPFFGFEWLVFADSEHIYATLNCENFRPGVPQHNHYNQVFPNFTNQHEVVVRYSCQRNEWEEIMFRGSPPAAYIDAFCVLGSRAYFFCFREREMHVLDFSPNLHTLCLKAVHDYQLDTTSLPDSLRKELAKFDRNKPEAATKGCLPSLAIDKGEASGIPGPFESQGLC